MPGSGCSGSWQQTDKEEVPKTEHFNSDSQVHMQVITEILELGLESFMFLIHLRNEMKALRSVA